MRLKIIFFFLFGFTATGAVAQVLSVKTSDIHFRKSVDQSSRELPVINWISPSREEARVAATERMEVAFEFTTSAVLNTLTLMVLERNDVITLTPPDAAGTSLIRQMIALQKGTTTLVVVAELASGLKVSSRRVIRVGASEGAVVTTDSTAAKPFGYSEKAVEGSLQVESMRQVGNNIIIRYNLVNPDPSKKFTVNLYSSLDDFRDALRNVKGDVRKMINNGAGEVTIDLSAFGEDFGNFEEKITFGLLAELYKPFVTINQRFNSLRAGTSQVVMWTFGKEIVPVIFAVVRNGKVVTQKRIAGEGTFLDIGPDFARGQYRIRISDAEDPTVFVESPEFSVEGGRGKPTDNENVAENVTITSEQNPGSTTSEPQQQETFRSKRRIPTYLKIVPVAVVAGVVYLLVRPKSENKSDRLPDPISPD